MKPYVLDQYDLCNRAGSFWDKHMSRSEKTKVQKLISLNLNNTYFNTLDNCIRGVTKGAQIEIAYVHSWEDKQVIVTESSILALTIVPIINPLSSSPTYKYLIPVKGDTIPLKIKSFKGILELEKDFDVALEYIWFREPLNLLFENNECLIEEAKKIVPSFFTHTYQTKTPYENYDLVVDFIKNKLELSGLEKATTVVAGLPIIRRGGVLLGRDTDSYKTVYTFDSGEVIPVYITHKELLVGSFYTPNTLLEDTGLTFHFPDRKDNYWYRRMNWDYGLSLEKITTYEGLLAQDSLTYAFTAGQDPLSNNGSKVHTRMWLVGYDGIQDSYWEEVARKETISGEYINSIIGLGNETTPNYNSIKATTAPTLEPAISSLPNIKLVNAVDVYFQYILKDRCFIVEIDERKIKNKQEVLNFILKNSPPNIIPLVRIRKTDYIVVDATIEDDYEKLFLITDANGVPILAS